MSLFSSTEKSMDMNVDGYVVTFSRAGIGTRMSFKGSLKLRIMRMLNTSLTHTCT